MCVALIGGMDRLEKNYENEAEKHGIQLKVFTKARKDLATRLGRIDALVVFTGKTSHRIKNEAMSVAKSQDIPVVMHHSCGVSSLRHCLGRLMAQHARMSSRVFDHTESII